MKNDNIVYFPGETKLDIDVDQILEQAKGKLEDVAVVGWTKDEQLLYIAISSPSVPEIVYLLQRANKEMLEIEG